MVLVVVGDVDHDEMENLIKESFKGWKQSPLKNKEEKNLGTKASSKVYVTMQDKTSTDFVVGTALGIDRYHPDYLPLYLATPIRKTHNRRLQHFEMENRQYCLL